MDTKKLNDVLKDLKGILVRIYDIGSDMMDKVEFLRSPMRKKVAWGMICVVLILTIRSGCSEGNISDVGAGAGMLQDLYSEYVKAVKAGNVDRVLALSYSDMKKSRFPDESPNRVKLLKDVAENCILDMKYLQHEYEYVDGEFGWLVTKADTPGWNGVFVTEFRKVDGRWMLLPLDYKTAYENWTDQRHEELSRIKLLASDLAFYKRTGMKSVDQNIVGAKPPVSYKEPESLDVLLIYPPWLNDDVANKPWHGKDEFVDKWGQKLRYVKDRENGDYIESAGPDGLFGTQDDVDSRAAGYK